MNIGIIIQARTGSTRLPNKMILPFYSDKGILETLLIRLKEAELNIPIILASTTNPNDTKLVEVVRNLGITVYRGDETNVLDRFIQAAAKSKIQKIIRICADNPFLDINALKQQIKGFKFLNVDYWCFCKKDKTPTIRTHYGFWTEGVRLDALIKVTELTNESKYQEHVTNYIYTNPENFKIHFEIINQSVEKEREIRLTIDTPKDFEIVKEIYSELINYKIPFEVDQVINYIKSKPTWISVMKNEIIKNTK